ncbi:MAG: hypothetical protein ABIQ52_08810 [Vicinamibacterales bacterium]
MLAITLDDFIDGQRDNLIGRCRAKVAQRSPPSVNKNLDDHGVPLLLDQIIDELRHGRSGNDEISETAKKHGNALLREGYTIGQVVHGYGDLCQSVTELAVELGAPISADDFRTLNRCLDDAIAAAVTEHARQHSVGETVRGSKSATELGNLADIALVAFEALQSGNVGVGGSTGAVLLVSLKAIRAFADRTIVEAAPLTPAVR